MRKLLLPSLLLCSIASAANFLVSIDAELRAALLPGELSAQSGISRGDTITFSANITLAQDLWAVQRSVTIGGGGYALGGAGAYCGLFLLDD